jgi:hypothetical protein
VISVIKFFIAELGTLVCFSSPHLLNLMYGGE